MSDATLRQLEYFIAAVEEGSVTAASQRLHLSQSALSMSLGELERALGVQVLVRHRRGVRPTRIGEQVLADARRLLADLDDLQTSARESHLGLTGRLIVGCYSTLSPIVLPPVLGAYVDRFPGVDLFFSEGSHDILIDELRNSTSDLAVLYEYGPDVIGHRDDLIFDVIFTAPPYVLLPEGHPLCDLESVSLDPATLANVDGVAILTDHTGFDYDAIVEAAPLVVDTRNAVKRPHPHVFRLGAPQPACAELRPEVAATTHRAA